MPLGIRRGWGCRLSVLGKAQSRASSSMEEGFNNCLRNEENLSGGHKEEKPKEGQDQCCFLEAENTASQPDANSKGSAEVDLMTDSESMLLS